MHVVVNRITFKPGVDWQDIAARVTEVSDRLRQEPEFIACDLVRVDDVEGFLIVRFTDLESLTRLSSTIAGPWFAAHLRPHLDGPVDRRVGERLSGS